MNGSLSQNIYFDREDIMCLLAAVEKHYRVRYFIDQEWTTDAQFRRFASYRELDDSVKLGVSTHGTSADVMFGIQFEPYLTIPTEFLEKRGYAQELTKAGIPLVYLGGIYEKTGELISGRVAFMHRIQENSQTLNFNERVPHYNALLKTAKELGAEIRKAYLIGASAWKQYKAGVPLVFQTGLKEGARFRE